MGVLDLVGMQKIFFITACSFLYFRSVTKTMLVIHQCFSYCWTALDNTAVSYCGPNQEVSWVWARAWEIAQPGQLTQANQSDIFYVRSCSPMKLEWKFLLNNYCLQTDWASVCWWWVIALASLEGWGFFPFNLLNSPLINKFSNICPSCFSPFMLRQTEWVI